MAYVCITGNEQNPSALEQRIERVLHTHPRVLCELRLDFLDLSPAAAFHLLARLPAEYAPRLVLTQRLKASGPLGKGGCSWDVNTWQSWWHDVMALRPWFAVDLDWLVLDRLAGEALAWKGKFRSRHAFFSLHGTLDEVSEALPEMIATAKEQDAGIKIACPVESARDLSRLQEMSQQMEGLPLRVCVAMGAAGRPWRWSRLSGDITYFAADAGSATAPGQEQFSAVLPYLATKHRPDLYLLLGDNPENRYGETRWNRVFLKRGAKARYVNCPNSDDAGALWAENALRWMGAAHVKGASVTKPFKLSFPSPTNTLSREEGRWDRTNTDGPAVAALLARAGVKPGAPVVVAGGGGAAKAVEEGLRAEGFHPCLWVRDHGKLGACPKGEALVSTWPGEYQEGLVAALPAQTNFLAVIDAQFSRPVSEAPLARWAQSQKIFYAPGSMWWKEQARGQDLVWFGADRLASAKEEILSLVPTSKSETLRAVALSLATGITIEIHNPALSEDTEFFSQACEKLGARVEKESAHWKIVPPKELKAPPDPIHMGEGATGLRILGALSTLFEGNLKLSGTARLQDRPAEDLLEALKLKPHAWPLTLPGGIALPEKVSLAKSSQFATGFLLAAAGALYRGKIFSYELELEGELRSTTYLDLTLSLLREAGFQAERKDRRVFLALAQKKSHFEFTIERDASSLAFLEVFGRRWKLSSFFTKSRQGDGDFPAILDCVLSGEAVSLKNHPDLAPPLWAAAAMMRLRLEINGAPHLRLKESDRAALLVEAALKIGAHAELREDGFVADFRNARYPCEEIFLRTDGDHRMAMAFGLLSTDYPDIQPDRKDCVRKSFPHFWHALNALEEALPG